MLSKVGRNSFLAVISPGEFIHEIEIEMRSEKLSYFRTSRCCQPMKFSKYF